MDQELTKRRLRASSGFSLVELLMVMGIMTLLLGLASLGASSALSGTRLEMAGQTVGDAIALARQEAVSKNTSTQVVFFKFPAGSEVAAWRGVQVWRIDEGPNGPVTTPITRVFTLPETMVISEAAALSPLLTASTITGTAPVADKGTVPYLGFRFRANGSVDSSIGTNNFLTLVSLRAQGQPPANYYTLQINPVTGKASVIRP